MRFYYCDSADENGVQCVERLDPSDTGREFTPEQVAVLADQYPDMIYFGVETP